LSENKDKKEFYIIESIRDLSDDIKFSHEQKVASLGFLATSVAHEMKNNLGSVRMILEGMLDSYYKDLPDDDIQKKYLNMIYNQIIASIKIPERLLKLAKNNGEEKEVFNINSSIDEVLSLLDYEAKRNGVGVKKIFKNNENNMIGNEADFKMIILNLAQNALKAMPSGGELTVEVSKDKNNVTIEIRDTGIGIENEKLSHIFEPFYSDGQSSRHHNVGLGLAIVKSLVDKIKGTIHVSSEVGKGTLFIIKLPKRKRNNLQN
jgi:signal transduction histidine kinase